MPDAEGLRVKMSMEILLNYLELGGVTALAGLLVWVGRMSWQASRLAGMLESRLMALEKEQKESAADCERKRQETMIAMQRESALAIKGVMLEIAQQLGKIGATQAVQGEMIKSVKEDVEAIFSRLNRRTDDQGTTEDRRRA